MQDIETNPGPPVLIISGSIHQGGSCFNEISIGRQCAFMSLSALLCANSLCISE